MSDREIKRCKFSGGTLWQDEGMVKCLMCSRPAEEQHGDGMTPTRPRLPKRPLAIDRDQANQPKAAKKGA